MRKWYTLAVAGVIAATFASAVNAQLSLWFDVRDSIAAINAPVAPYTVQATNGGGRGDGQVCYISPTMSNNSHIYTAGPNTHNASQRTLTLYGDFTGNTGEVLSSLGLDIAIAAPAAPPANRLASVTFTAFNAQADVGVITSAMAWDGTNAASLTPTTAGFTNFRAVRVPVAAGPVFDPNLGIKPGQGYRLGRLGLQAAARAAKPAPVSTLGVKMSVGELLITRVSQTGADPLPVNFGYFNGSPEAATGNGSTQGATSANDDATIVITQKGDYIGTTAGSPPNGDTNNLDIAPFLVVRGNNTGKTQREIWLGDFDGNGVVNNLDIAGFLAVRLANP